MDMRSRGKADFQGAILPKSEAGKYRSRNVADQPGGFSGFEFLCLTFAFFSPKVGVLH
jgi:hypothetical protein